MSYCVEIAETFVLNTRTVVTAAYKTHLNKVAMFVIVFRSKCLRLFRYPPLAPFYSR